MEGSDQPVRRQSVDFVTQRVREQLDCAVSRSTVWRWLDEAAIKPWRYRHWIFPRDDQFAKKAGPILDLYAGRWKRQPLGENEFVLSADEKTSLQARRRTHRGRPPAPGYPAHIEHEYERQGALQYLAAWDVHRGWVHGRCELHSGIDPFMRLVEQVMSTEPYASAERVFWIVDNGSSHRGQASIDRLQTAWPNARLLHTPVHASWLNQIEIYFSSLQRHVLTPNTFGDLQELARCLHEYAALSNANPQPFDWNFTRSKLRRYLQRLDHRQAA